MSQGRALTAGEIRLARSLFRDSVDYHRVKIHHAKYIFFQPDNSGMTPNGEIYVAGRAYRDDYSTTDGESECFFIHEMAHVWQYQNSILRVKTSAIREIVRHGFRYEKAYRYTLSRNKDLRDFGLEQQAAIIEDFYRALRLGVGFHKDARGDYRMLNPSAEREELIECVMCRFIADPRYACGR